MEFVERFVYDLQRDKQSLMCNYGACRVIAKLNAVSTHLFFYFFCQTTFCYYVFYFTEVTEHINSSVFVRETGFLGVMHNMTRVGEKGLYMKYSWIKCLKDTSTVT